MSKHHRKPGKPPQIERSIHASKKLLSEAYEINPPEDNQLERERRKAFWVSVHVVLFGGADTLSALLLYIYTRTDVQLDFAVLFSIWAFGLAELGLQVNRSLGYPWWLVSTRFYNAAQHMRQKTKYLNRPSDRWNMFAGTYLWIIGLHLFVLFVPNLFDYFIFSSAMITSALVIHAIFAYLRYGFKRSRKQHLNTPVYHNITDTIEDLEAGYLIGDDGEIEKAKRSE